MRLIPKIKNETAGHRFLRMILVICVFIGTAWLYSVHFDKTLADLQSKNAILDRTDSLTKSQRNNFKELAGYFEDLGVELRIRINAGLLEPEEFEAKKTAFFGLDIVNKNLLVRLPAVWERVLGRDYLNKLQKDCMTPYFQRDSWPTGFLNCVVDVYKKMFAITTNKEAL